MDSSAAAGRPPDGGFSSARGPTTAHLVLTDGTVFTGEPIGAPATTVAGRLTVTTVVTGYQATIIDPARSGEIITFTTPQVGNQGVEPDDAAAPTPVCHGIVVRELTRRGSNWRSVGELADWLATQGIAGIAEVDTRRLARHLARSGPMAGAFGTADPDDLLHAARVEGDRTGEKR